MGAVTDVAVDDELGVWADLASEFDDIRDELVMGGNFAHFFLSAEMNGDGGGVFGQKGGEPGLVFRGVRPAETSFDGNG